MDKFEINLIMKYSKEKYILNNLINPNKNPMTNSNIPHHTFEDYLACHKVNVHNKGFHDM
jgi:hypothetical protein